MLAMILFSSCTANVAVLTGNYYLDGNKQNEYIQIINDDAMRLINFDIDYLTKYLIEEGTDYTGKDAEDFMKRHDLPNLFNEVISFDYDETDHIIYLRALSKTSEDFLIVNYRMTHIDKNTILFLENIYIRR